MNYYIIPAAFLTAIILSVIFAVVAADRRSGRSILLFFLLIFLVGWAGQLWILPFGPRPWGVSLLPLFFVVLIFSLLIAAMTPAYPSQKDKTNSADASMVFFGVFFWFLVTVLVTVIVIGHYHITPTWVGPYE
jgi:hypothetical protein